MMQVCNGCGGTVVHIGSKLVKCEYCGRLYSWSEDALNDANIEEAYSEANALSKSEEESDQLEAIHIFEALGAYKDSFSRVQECREFISNAKVIAEDRRLADLRQAELDEIERKKNEEEEKLKRKKTRTVFLVVSAIAIAVFSIGMISNSSKNSKYEEAVALYESGKYEDSLVLFEGLTNYSNADEYAVNAKEAIAERDNTYKRGVGYFDSGLYVNAMNELTPIAEYLDAQEYIQKSAASLYEQAVKDYEAEDYSSAKEKLMVIPQSCNEYIDGNNLLAEVDKILTEQQKQNDYNQALTAYENEEYETAQSLFIGLGAYSDAQSYLTEIGTMYYNQAQELYNAGNYVECVSITEYIDAVEEWCNYEISNELKEAAIDSYNGMVRENAIDSYKSNGNDAMIEYLNSMICDFFTQDDTFILKKEISQKYLPTALSDCVLLDNKKLNGSTEYQVEDVFRNMYEFGIEYFDPYLFSYIDMEMIETYEVYYLNKEYVNFTATIVPYHSGGDAANFIIYTDGIQAFSCTVDDQSRPQKIDLDVSGVEELKIAFIDGYNGHFLLANPYLYQSY